MKIIKASAEILSPTITNQDEINDMFQRMELAGRTCYKSNDLITPVSARKFVEKLVLSHHEAMLEHASMTVRFVVDRGVSHELVRHRIASFAQESSRFCDYSKDKFGNELTFIEPCFWEKGTAKYSAWEDAMKLAESFYFQLLAYGATPQEARSVLPNSLKTEVIMTANMREIRHFLKLRAAGVTGAPHPQMLEVSVPLYQKCVNVMPELFYDIVVPSDVLRKYGDTEL